MKREPERDRSQQKRKRRRQARRLAAEGTITILTRLLTERHYLLINGEAQQVTVIEAIILQLLQKASVGEKRAMKGVLKYQQFANRRMPKRLNLRFVDDEYTRRATGRGGSDHHE